MRHGRAKTDLCIGLGFEFDHGARWPEGHQFALPQLVRDQNGTHPHSGSANSLPGGRLVAPAFSSLQMHGEIVHRRRGFGSHLSRFRDCRGGHSPAHRGE
jgi:hypothetical protein